MKRTLTLIGLFAALTSSRLLADTVTYNLQDIGTFTGYQEANSGQTYSGNGFVGLYGPAVGNTFGHLFGLEQSGFSRTAIQVDVSALAGATVASATLSFDVLDGSGTPQVVTVGSYVGDGALGWDWAPVFGASNGYSVGHGSNALDITALVSGLIAGGNPWLGLNLSGSSEYAWTYTYAGYGYSADRANVRLTIEYAAAGVPDQGSSLGLLALALGGLVALRRKLR